MSTLRRRGRPLVPSTPKTRARTPRARCGISPMRTGEEYSTVCAAMAIAPDKPRVTVFGPDPLLSVTIERAGTGDEIHLHPAGQGVWVARTAAELGASPILCAFAGGETGHALTAQLETLPASAGSWARPGRAAATWSIAAAASGGSSPRRRDRLRTGMRWMIRCRSPVRRQSKAPCWCCVTRGPARGCPMMFSRRSSPTCRAQGSRGGGLGKLPAPRARHRRPPRGRADPPSRRDPPAHRAGASLVRLSGRMRSGRSLPPPGGSLGGEDRRGNHDHWAVRVLDHSVGDASQQE